MHATKEDVRMQKKSFVFKGMLLVLLLLALGLSGCAAVPLVAMGVGAESITKKLFDKKPNGEVSPAAKGTVLSQVVESEMDKEDREKMFTVIDGGHSDKTVSWFNAHTGKEFTVTPKQAYHPVSEMPEFLCRGTMIEQISGKHRKSVTFKACRDPKTMSWRLMNSSKS